MIGKPPPRPPGPARKLDLVELRIANLRRELESESEPRGDNDARLVASVLASAEVAAGRLDLTGVLAPRRTRLRLATGLAVATLATLAGLRSPELAQTFDKK